MAIKLKEKPIFIIGYERSGTTLLMAMLGCHPRIAIPEVGWLFPRIYPWRYTYGDLSIDSNFRIMAAEMLFGLNQPLWGMSLNPMTAVDEIISMVTERSFAGIYTTMHLRYAKEFGNKPRWGQKTPNNLYFVPQILDNFPNAQFIFITRDGRDACATSIESAFGAGNIYGAADTWNAANTFVKPFREKYDSSTWLDVKYEELVRETVKTLKKICEFIGEQYAPEMLEFYRTSTGVARGKQRDHAPLGHAVSDRYVGIYKHLLSIRDQQIYAAVAGKPTGKPDTNWTWSQSNCRKRKRRSGGNGTGGPAQSVSTVPADISFSRATGTGWWNRGWSENKRASGATRI